MLDLKKIEYDFFFISSIILPSANMSTQNVSFAEKMRATSAEKKTEIEANIALKVTAAQAKRIERTNQVRDELFTTLTNKYHDTIKRGICNAARNGKNAKYINFTRDDFKANCHGIGFPQHVLADWLREMSNPDSKYLPIASSDDNWWNQGDKMHFQGILFDVWNNKAFTVVFTW